MYKYDSHEMEIIRFTEDDAFIAAAQKSGGELPIAGSKPELSDQ